MNLTKHWRRKMSESKGIPRGWEIVRIGQVCSFEYGKALKATKRNKAGKFPVLGSNGCVGFHDTYLVNGPGIVIGRKGAAGEISFVGKNFWPIDTTYFLKLNKDLSLLYFYFLLKSLRLNQFEKSTAIPGLNRNDAYDQIIPLPPFPEQHRIVAKIEELLSSLDKGIESLKTAQQQLKVYRQAVLKWAFDGIKSEKEVEEITYEHSIGLVRSNNQQNAKGIGLPYIKMNNVDLNGNVDFTKVVYVEVSKDEAEKYALKKGDILINTRNSVELVGKTGIVREEKPNCVFNNNLLRIRTKSEYNPLFIGYQLISPWLRKQMLKEKKATTNVCALYQRDIFPLKVKVTDSMKQNAIVGEIESRLSVCDKMEEGIEHSLKQSEALRQSILKKAFEGKLVPQDPNDEPASVLLERIKAEREKNKPQNPPRWQTGKTKKAKL
jgi:type I restriction enzyme S subunit